LNIPIPPQEKIETEEKKLPGVFESFMLALLPVLLIALAVIANTFFPGESIAEESDPFYWRCHIALLLSVLLAVLILGIAKGKINAASNAMAE
jgi:H+/gluconate symporter-like permease